MPSQERRSNYPLTPDSTVPIPAEWFDVPVARFHEVYAWETLADMPECVVRQAARLGLSHLLETPDWLKTEVFC